MPATGSLCVTQRVLLVTLGLVGWAICGATIVIGRQVVSMQTTLVVHALVAPTAFGFLTWIYRRRYQTPRPLTIALVFLTIVVGIDVLFVAPVLERSYDMFHSVLGTWIPFVSIALVSYVVARMTTARRRTTPSEKQKTGTSEQLG